MSNWVSLIFGFAVICIPIMLLGISNNTHELDDYNPDINIDMLNVETITYYTYHNEISNKAVTIAFEKWKEKNPQLNFTKTTNNPLLKINLTSTDYPQYSFETMYSDDDYPVRFIKSIPIITQGQYDESNMTIELSNNLSFREQVDTIMHEFGHTLGLVHHCNHSHLMYSYNSDDCEDIEYNNLGLNIPDTVTPDCRPNNDCKSREQLIEEQMKYDQNR